MCLTRLARLVEVDQDQEAGVVDQDGSKHRVSLAVVNAGDVPPAPGAWMLMNSGIPVAVISDSEAHELMETWKEIEDDGHADR